MKRVEFKELKNQDLKQLMQKLRQAKKDYDEALMDKNMKKLKDVRAASKKRKDIARMETLIRQKELLGELKSKVESGVKTSDTFRKGDK